MEEELNRLSKMEPGSKNYQIELNKIREAKVREIRKILDGVFVVFKAYIRLKKDKKGDVIPFPDLMKKTWADLAKDAGDRPLIEVSGVPNMKRWLSNSAFLRFKSRSLATIDPYQSSGKNCGYDLDNEILPNPLGERINSRTLLFTLGIFNPSNTNLKSGTITKRPALQVFLHRHPLFQRSLGCRIILGYLGNCDICCC